MKTHRFTLEVKTTRSLRNAMLAVLCAFARRDPDGCEFKLRKSPPKAAPERVPFACCAICLRPFSEHVGPEGRQCPDTPPAPVAAKLTPKRLTPEMMTATKNELVDKFLSWKLPETVRVDAIAYEPHGNFDRYGTNLLSASEAGQMIDHLLTTVPDISASIAQAAADHITEQIDREMTERPTPITDEMLWQYDHLGPNWLATEILGPFARNLERQLDEAREQRDRLAEALARTRNMIRSHPDAAETCADTALAAVKETTNDSGHPTAVSDSD